MSKIGKQPIEIPAGVSISNEDGVCSIAGPKGTVNIPILPDISVSQTEAGISVAIEKDVPQARANWGTMRSLLQNAVDGVVNEHIKRLEIEGVGYRVTASSPKELVFNLGFSHSISFPLPEGITAEVSDNNKIAISGIQKELVGQIAANIRKLKKPEPYKGKGIRYAGEVVRRKVGKKTA